MKRLALMPFLIVFLLLSGGGCFLLARQLTPPQAVLEIQLMADSAPDTLILPGRFADPDILQSSEGSQLYFGVEPETPGHKFEVYTATSSDGQQWELYEEPLLQFATFPDVIQLPDGRVRMFFQRGQEILSAISHDALSFALESGVRIRSTGELDDDGVAAPTVVQKPDGSFFMVFRATASGRYQPTSINATTTALLSAVSDDGLLWARTGIVVDGRNDMFDGSVDGPELFYDPAGLLHLRFWSPGSLVNRSRSGQYDMVSSDHGLTWSEPISFNNDILGGDPTYLYQGDQLYMYYTRLTKGIYVRGL